MAGRDRRHCRAAGLVTLAFLMANWYRGRTRKYLSVRVDEQPTLQLGVGPTAGFGFIGSGDTREVVRDPAPTADMRLRYRGGRRVDVMSENATTSALTRERLEVSDATGVAHSLVINATAKPIVAGPEAVEGDIWGTSYPTPSFSQACNRTAVIHGIDQIARA